MSDSTTPAKKVKKPAQKKPVDHPPYKTMIEAAIKALKERGGSSRLAILKHIMTNFKVGNDQNKVNSRVKVALRNMVAKKYLKQVKGTGASGSFKLGDKEDKPKAAKKKPATKKPKATKIAKPKTASKKSPTKKKTTKKAAPAKKATKKTPKKSVKKSPKKTSKKAAPKKK